MNIKYNMQNRSRKDLDEIIKRCNDLNTETNVLIGEFSAYTEYDSFEEHAIELDRVIREKTTCVNVN